MNAIYKNNFNYFIYYNFYRYSVFFEEPDFQCPYTIKAIENLGIPLEKLKLLNFEYFQIEGTTKIQQLLSYLIHLSQQYEIFKRVIKERNHLKKIDREIGRKFKNITFPTEISSQQISDEILENSEYPNYESNPPKSNRNLQLYLNHSRTYTNEERQNVIMKKLEQKKLNAENYIKNLTMKKFDGELYQQEIKQKIKEVLKKKNEFVNEKASKAKKDIEYTEQIIEKNKEKKKDKEYSFPALQSVYREKMKELEDRIDKEKNKNFDKIKDFNHKNKSYAKIAQKHIKKLKQQEEQEISRKISELEKKELDIAQKNLDKMKKYAKMGEDQEKHQHEQLCKKYIIDEIDSKNKINNFLYNFQSQYDSTTNKRRKILEEKSNSIKKNLEENMKTFTENKERNLEKIEEWRNELKNKIDVKMEGAKNVENLKKNKQEFLSHILFEKNQKILDLKEEEENKLTEKRNTLILKSIHLKNKIGMRRSEEKFVVEERKDYNLKLNKYKTNLLDKVTI